MQAPADLQVIGAELAIRWPDGKESYLALEEMRRRCPCAACAGEPGLTRPLPAVGIELKGESFRLKGMQTVGGYAIQPTWEDGHGTGIFSWEYLRKIAPPVG
ncbi:MAG: DUF971 domain-containing protein [Verrucomicrobia bacterium]|nr:DUF971 domain-containing protein [Verrucomicrobiota bacterium]